MDNNTEGGSVQAKMQAQYCADFTNPFTTSMVPKGSTDSQGSAIEEIHTPRVQTRTDSSAFIFLGSLQTGLVGRRYRPSEYTTSKTVRETARGAIFADHPFSLPRESKCGGKSWSTCLQHPRSRNTGDSQMQCIDQTWSW